MHIYTIRVWRGLRCVWCRWWEADRRMRRPNFQWLAFCQRESGKQTNKKKTPLRSCIVVVLAIEHVQRSEGRCIQADVKRATKWQKKNCIIHIIHPSQACFWSSSTFFFFFLDMEILQPLRRDVQGEKYGVNSDWISTERRASWIFQHCSTVSRLNRCVRHWWRRASFQEACGT